MAILGQTQVLFGDMVHLYAETVLKAVNFACDLGLHTCIVW